jgi:hypothetical protein
LTGTALSINILGITPAASTPTAPQDKITVPVVQDGSIATPAASDPLIELLKQLLPADNPIGTLLERFRQAAALSTPETTEENSFAEVIELLRNLPVDLKNVTADQLRKVIERLGLRYEPMLQEAFTQRTPPAVPHLTAQNLKAALLQFLVTQPPRTSVLSAAGDTPAATPMTETGLRQEIARMLGKLAQENLESLLVKQLEVQSRTVTPEKAGQPSSGTTGPGTVPAEPSQAAQVLTKILTALEGHDMPEMKSELIKMLKGSPGGTGKPVLELPINEGSSGGEQPLTMDDFKQALSKLSLPDLEELTDQVLSGGDPTLKASKTQRLTAAVAPESEQAPAAPQKSDSSAQPVAREGKTTVAGPDQPGSRQMMEQPAQAVTKNAEGTEPGSRSSALPLSPGRSAGTIHEQAHELLTAIERTQVLNSINGERGHPVTFQIPILVDSQTSTAQFYVERRQDESRTVPPEDRHYSIVALLDLSGLGNLRIDLALYRKNLSVKVTVERPDAEVFATQLLPDLGKALKERGFALEFLKCERKVDGGTDATGLRDRTLPQNVVNLRV